MFARPSHPVLTFPSCLTVLRMCALLFTYLIISFRCAVGRSVGLRTFRKGEKEKYATIKVTGYRCMYTHKHTSNDSSPNSVKFNISPRWKLRRVAGHLWTSQQCGYIGIQLLHGPNCSKIIHCACLGWAWRLHMHVCMQKQLVLYCHTPATPGGGPKRPSNRDGDPIQHKSSMVDTLPTYKKFNT